MSDRQKSIPRTSEVFRESFLARLLKPEQQEAVRTFGEMLFLLVLEGDLIVGDRENEPPDYFLWEFSSAALDVHQAADALDDIGMQYAHGSLDRDDIHHSIYAEQLARDIRAVARAIDERIAAAQEQQPPAAP